METLGVILILVIATFAMFYVIKLENPQSENKVSELTHEYDGSYSAVSSSILSINLADTTGIGQHFVECSVWALQELNYKFTEYCRTKGLVHKEPDGYIKFETYAGSALRNKWILRTKDPEFKVGSIVARPQRSVYSISEGGMTIVDLFKIVDIYALSGTFILEDLKQHFYIKCDGKGNYKIG